MSRLRLRSVGIALGYVALAVVTSGATRALMQVPQEPPPELTGTLSARVANPGGRVDRIALTVGDGGSGPYKAILAGDPSLPKHTIYRPRDLSPFGAENRLPIVVWGNGGCRNGSGEVRDFLSEVASHGFLVIAIGPASVSATQGWESPGDTKASQLLDAVAWAVAQDEKDGPYRGRIDTKKVAAMGGSCGGLQALEVSPDPRITTTVLFNSGVFNEPPKLPGGMKLSLPDVSKDMLKKLHGPIAYFIGGPKDLAYKNAVDDFARIDHIPALLANQDKGHAGTLTEPRGGAFAVAGIAWLKWHLKGDEEAKKMFVGEPCGLAADPKWTVERKNLPNSAGRAAAPPASPGAASTGGAGKWHAEFDTVVGPMKYDYEFKVDGDKLTGTATGGRSDEKHNPTDIGEGKVKGDDITFVETITIMGMEVSIKYTGKLVGDEIRFNREVGSFATEEIVAKRVRGDKPTGK
jgi:dienelactone hydrolase